jgi:SulP family sulfate permease
LIIGALTAYFWDGTCPLLEKFHLEFQIYRLNPIQHYTTRSIHLNSKVCRRAGRGSIDLLTSVIADNETKTRHNSNRELIGQGIGNMLAAAFGESLVQEQRKVP